LDRSKELREARRPTAAEFARMSSSMQLTLVIIWRAQRSSREAVAGKPAPSRPFDTRE
jgi:hypothetical protein